ncbi:hypothetical protein [Streptomyces yaizuensis]|uniref:Polyprenyl synthetase n=1 Tax=Streptomyces yaizuensis TaxID=2989713 RepID=A0ABQ5P2W9_9ACTN|nr:hypothetical protein [Streptomyces sp. YSPA8]GLF96847.1 hypothetical protein SYYSPA8_21140 [Streptomyces sp. YSPA8]
MTQEQGNGPGAGRRSDEAVLLVAGAVDLVLEQAEGALRRVRSLLGRSDLGDLAQEVRRDLVLRGRHSGLDPARVVSAESHLELLARRARERERRGGPVGPGGARDAESGAPGDGRGGPGR